MLDSWITEEISPLSQPQELRRAGIIFYISIWEFDPVRETRLGPLIIASERQQHREQKAMSLRKRWSTRLTRHLSPVPVVHHIVDYARFAAFPE